MSLNDNVFSPEDLEILMNIATSTTPAAFVSNSNVTTTITTAQSCSFPNIVAATSRTSTPIPSQIFPGLGDSLDSIPFFSDNEITDIFRASGDISTTTTVSSNNRISVPSMNLIPITTSSQIHGNTIIPHSAGSSGSPSIIKVSANPPMITTTVFQLSSVRVVPSQILPKFPTYLPPPQSLPRLPTYDQVVRKFVERDTEVKNLKQHHTKAIQYHVSVERQVKSHLNKAKADASFYKRQIKLHDNMEKDVAHRYNKLVSIKGIIERYAIENATEFFEGTNKCLMDLQNKLGASQPFTMQELSNFDLTLTMGQLNEIEREMSHQIGIHDTYIHFRPLRTYPQNVQQAKFVIDSYENVMRCMAVVTNKLKNSIQLCAKYGIKWPLPKEVDVVEVVTSSN